MSPRLRLMHTCTEHLITLLPPIRVTQVRPLALFVLGMRWTGQVHLRGIAAALPLPVADASSEQRVRRWLRTSRVAVAPRWRVLPQQERWSDPQIR